MNIRLLIIIFLLPSYGFSQDDTGIKFEQILSWDQVRAKAKSEHKYIFMDCYATWCGPCKAMDKTVYPDSAVGVFLNNNFISVKVQMDTSKHDDEEIKARYQDAHEIGKLYAVQSLPTFLFFSPEGILVHKGIGFQPADNFLILAVDAMDPRKQYYTLLNAYNNGDRNFKTVSALAHIALALQEYDLGDRIVEDFLKNYSSTLTDTQLFTKEILLFIGEDLYKLHYDDRLFQLILKHPVDADSLVHNPNYSNQVINNIIQREELFEKLWADAANKVPVTKNPDWNTIEVTISSKYHLPVEVVEKMVSQARFNFYAIMHDWANYTRYANLAIKKYPPTQKSSSLSLLLGGYAEMIRDDSWALNTLAWTMYARCNDKQLLKKALSWISLSMEISSRTNRNYYQYWDTKAHLLYKLGKFDEAVNCEAAAIQSLNSLPENIRKTFAGTEGFSEVLQKMKNREPASNLK